MKGWVLVTGAAKRIGRAIALELAAAGWDVAVHYHASRREALKTAKDIQKLGRKACLVELDLGNLWLAGKLIPALAKELGPITALVNNAALFLPDRLDRGNRQERINAEAPWILGEALYRQLPRGASCAIVNLLDADANAPEFSRYNESKHMLAAMTLRMAMGFAPAVRVNGIAPGPVLRGARQTREHFNRLARKTPLGKAAAPEDIAAAVRFLIENPSVTGVILPIGGGTHPEK